ncbi:Asparagine synthase [Candidatus Gugararchaeum adminiculabundum]|nr:Asparagine synthase [Candidatus Gugararchaeum adminiculabundum]
MKEKILTESEIQEGAKEFEKIYGSDLLAVELSYTTSVLCKMAKDAGVKILLSGAGAEELFAGYHRHVLHFQEGKDLRKLLDEELASLPQRDIARAESIAKKSGIKLICPLLGERVISAAREFPAEKNISISQGGEITKKIVLRDAAKFLGVPDLARLRPKKAMQYGSGVHKAFMARREKFPPGTRNPFKGQSKT